MPLTQCSSDQAKGVAYRCPSGNDHDKIYASDKVCPSCGQPIDWAVIEKVSTIIPNESDVLKVIPNGIVSVGETGEEATGHSQDGE